MLKIINYKVKQKGYGRQALYIDLSNGEKSIYVMDVFPKLLEHFERKYTLVDCVYEDSEGNITDGNRYYKLRNVFNTTLELLNTALKLWLRDHDREL